MSKHSIHLNQIESEPGNVFYSFFLWAERLSAEVLTSYHEDSEGLIRWKGSETAILREGPAAARKLGFIVEEFEEGFSAVLPMRQAVSPGACYVVTVVKEADDELGTLIEFTSNECRGKNDRWTFAQHGWKFKPAGNMSLTYDFAKPAIPLFQ